MDFFICLVYTSLGLLSGIIYDIFYVARSVVCGIYVGQLTLKDKIFTAVLDFLYCVILTFGFIFLMVIFSVDTLRWFMFVGTAFGVILYLKSIHRIVAFFVKKIYNKIKPKGVCHDGGETQ